MLSNFTGKMNKQVSLVYELHSRVKKILSLHKALSEENLKLKSANAQLAEQIQELKNKLKQAEETNKTLRLAQALGADAGGDQNTRDLKIKLNKYIHEIDRCLAILHQ